MIAALLGISGVLVGAVLTQLFATSSEWRNRRLIAMVEVAAASGRVVGADDRLYEILHGGNTPPLTDSRVVAALTERNEAHYDWRRARAQVEILIADDKRLDQAMDHLAVHRAEASVWILTYLKDGEYFKYADFTEVDKRSWRGMRAARFEIMDYSCLRSRLDARWFSLLSLRFSGYRAKHIPRVNEVRTFVHDHSAEQSG